MRPVALAGISALAVAAFIAVPHHPHTSPGGPTAPLTALETSTALIPGAVIGNLFVTSPSVPATLADSPVPPQAGAFSAATVSRMLAFMQSAAGDPYTQQNPERFGPGQYDCSGLVWAAATAAGIALPQGDALASLEAQFFGAMHGVSVFTNESEVEAGDLLFFTGADPMPSQYGPIGHVGMAVSSTEFISAYDTELGVVTLPIPQGGGFVVAESLDG